ncbi:MAG: very short patch repair endonuclease [candidate division Zixibacteria bacterium]|nr:very short patch repair endonuclease [candidate division Zixibacteria bacterium]
MSDVFSVRKRSEIMSRVRGSGNKETEIALLKLLRKYKVSGWRRNYPQVGKPDFAFPKNRVAVFVDGCFWHGCPKHSSQPASNRKFWKKKLESNKKRDKVVNKTLRQQGWGVVRIWEHELSKNPNGSILKIAKVLGVRTKNLFN